MRQGQGPPGFDILGSRKAGGQKENHLFMYTYIHIYIRVLLSFVLGGGDELEDSFWGNGGGSVVSFRASRDSIKPTESSLFGAMFGWRKWGLFGGES